MAATINVLTDAASLEAWNIKAFRREIAAVIADGGQLYVF